MRGPIAIVAIAGLAGWLSLGVAHGASAAPLSVTSGNFTFSADSADVAAGAEVVGYSGPSDVVVPPSVVIAGVTYAVRSIAPFTFVAFGLTSVTLPNSVTDIGEEAFGFNASLTAVSLGSSVSDIGVFAFVNDGLTTVTMPDTVTVIDYASFYGNQLTSVVIPASVVTLGIDAFAENPLTSVTFLGAAPPDLRDASSNQGPFGTGAGMTVTYQWRFGTPQTENGFTEPTWLGYASRVMATVSFDLAGHGAAIAPQVIDSGDVAVLPIDPVAAGWVFTGWFTDTALTTRANFDDPVVADETITAGWVTTLAPTGSSSGYAVPAAILALGAGSLLMLGGRRRAIRRKA